MKSDWSIGEGIDQVHWTIDLFDLIPYKGFTFLSVIHSISFDSLLHCVHLKINFRQNYKTDWAWRTGHLKLHFAHDMIFSLSYQVNK